MGFTLAPLAALLFHMGITSQLSQQALAVSGPGGTSRTEMVATVAAQRMELFGASCLNAALAAPGAVSPSVLVTLPSGVTVPTNAVCMTTAAAPGRNVYAYAPSVPGEATNIISDVGSAYNWFVVQSAGQAVNLQTGLASAVPTTIPVGSVVDWILANP
jgi:hypothetical protein